jgi:predicted nucleic acid-binding protein
VKVVYVDTGAFIALTNKRDQVHDAAAKQFLGLTAERAILVTSNLVVAETATRLGYDVGLHVALAFRNILDAVARNGALTVGYADAEIDAAAWDVMARFGLSCAEVYGLRRSRNGRRDEGDRDLRLRWRLSGHGVHARALRGTSTPLLPAC